MPLISNSYITKNEYYMKIRDINASDFHIVLIVPINVSDFHIVLIFTHF